VEFDSDTHIEVLERESGAIRLKIDVFGKRCTNNNDLTNRPHLAVAKILRPAKLAANVYVTTRVKLEAVGFIVTEILAK
jgi:hypothetical protein